MFVRVFHAFFFFFSTFAVATIISAKLQNYLLVFSRFFLHIFFTVVVESSSASASHTISFDRVFFSFFSFIDSLRFTSKHKFCKRDRRMWPFVNCFVRDFATRAENKFIYSTLAFSSRQWRNKNVGREKMKWNSAHIRNGEKIECDRARVVRDTHANPKRSFQRFQVSPF